MKRRTARRGTAPALRGAASYRLTALLAALWLASCGRVLPETYVLKQDFDGFKYRRYQKTLGVEIPVEGNEAVGHTATYLRRRGNQVGVATAFVTVYAQARSLAAEARERLTALQGYRFSVTELSGEHVWQLDGGERELWVAWVSGRYLIKLGAPEGEPLPDAIADAYLALYPSDLDEHGRAEPDALSAGKSRAELAEHEPERERDVPASLGENAPR